MVTPTTRPHSVLHTAWRLVGRLNFELATQVLQRAVRRHQARVGAMDLASLIKALTVQNRVLENLERTDPSDKNFLMVTLNQVRRHVASASWMLGR